jgi:hypothetical protein
MKPKSKDTTKAASKSSKAAVRGTKVTPAKARRIPDLPIGPSNTRGADQVVGGKPGDTPTESISFNLGQTHNTYSSQ